MSLDPTYSLLWVIWVVMFFVIEGCALAKKRGTPNGTLTWNVRELFKLYSRSHFWGRLIVAMVLGWLVWHFMYPVQPN